jgi:hypothetical protein
MYPEQWYRPEYQEWSAEVAAAEEAAKKAAIATADAMGRYDLWDWDYEKNDFQSIDTVREKFEAWVKAHASWRAIIEKSP